MLSHRDVFGGWRESRYQENAAQALLESFREAAILAGKGIAQKDGTVSGIQITHRVRTCLEV